MQRESRKGGRRRKNERGRLLGMEGVVDWSSC